MEKKKIIIIELTLKEYKIKIVKKNVLIKIIIPIIRFFMTTYAIDSVTGYHCSDQPFDDNYFYSLQQNYV